MPLARALVDMLVCPKCKQHLIYFEAGAFLLCSTCRFRFRIDNRVPVLLLEEVEQVSADQVDRWMKQAKEQGLTGV